MEWLAFDYLDYLMLVPHLQLKVLGRKLSNNNNKNQAERRRNCYKYGQMQRLQTFGPKNQNTSNQSV